VVLKACVGPQVERIIFGKRYESRKGTCEKNSLSVQQWTISDAKKQIRDFSEDHEAKVMERHREM